MGAHGWYGDARSELRIPSGFRLDDLDPSATPGYEGDKASGAKELAKRAERLSDLQERLYAESRAATARSAVLLILQGMDTAGKGGIVRHVLGSVDPQGVQLHSFGAPSPEEAAHDFLWRIERRLPRHGFIGVFDRSHYEDVLVGRVRALAGPEEIERRYGAINDFEARAAGTGIRIGKVMLHLSRDEQRERLQERLDRPDKHWKYSPGDIDDRLLWREYREAYEIAFERTSTEVAPWYAVPADRKWYARLAVQELLIAALEDIDPEWPAASFDVEAEKKRLADS
jgi:PPK2 family polyphosphate:nucleotide phosphotransferase